MTVEASKNKESFGFKAIFLGLITAILFIESIYILVTSIRRGFLKKETLSKKSDFGFDFKIIMKS